MTSGLTIPIKRQTLEKKSNKTNQLVNNCLFGLMENDGELRNYWQHNWLPPKSKNKSKNKSNNNNNKTYGGGENLIDGTSI